MCEASQTKRQTRGTKDGIHRLAAASPFIYCGANMFDPFVIKQQRNEIKYYGAMFTCMARWAAHIEITDLSILTISPCVTRFHCLFSHGLMVGSSFLTVAQLLGEFFPKLTVFWKNKHKHIPMLINNAFLVWLTKIKQAFAVLYLRVGYYCSSC